MSDKPVLIKAARLWDGLGQEVVLNAFLLIKNRQIDTIGLQKDLGESDATGLASQAEVYDLGAATLMPGLINMHTHLNFSASATVLQDFFQDSKAGIATLTIRAMNHLANALRVGVTTIRDCGSLNEVVFALRSAVESGLIAGPRIVASGNGITTTGGHCYYVGIEADSADEVRKAVRSQVKAGADFIKIFSTGGGLTPGTNIYEAQYTEEQMKAATQEARRLGKRVSSHAHGVPGVANSVAARVTTIEHCSYFTPDGVEYQPELARQIAEAGIYVVPTISVGRPRPNQPTPTAAVLKFQATRQNRAENLRKMFDLGVVLVSGSDAGVAGVNFDDFPVDPSLLVDELGLHPWQALMTATSHAARAIGLEDTGVLQPGKRADLLAVAGNPLENIADLQATRMVVAAGKIAVRPAPVISALA